MNPTYVIAFDVIHTTSGVKIVANYPDGSSDSGQGVNYGEAFDALAPKVAQAMAEDLAVTA